MSTTYRQLLLEYCAELHSLPLQSFVFVVLGYEENNCLSRLVYQPQHIHAFNVKLPRTYYKNYEYGKIGETVLAELIDITERISYYHDQICHFNEPFGFKKMADMVFYRLLVVPLLKNGEIIAFGLYYFDNETSDTIINVNRLFKLLQQIYASASSEYEESLNKTVSTLPYWLLQTNNNVYLSQNLIIEIPTLLPLAQDKIVDLMPLLEKHQLTVSKKEKYEGHSLYVIEPVKQQKTLLLSKEAVRIRAVVEKFTVIYCRYIGLDEFTFDEIYRHITEKSEKMIERYVSNFYKINDESLAIIVDGHLERRLIERFSSKNPSLQVLYARSETDVPKKSDLIMLFDYFEICEDEHFVKEHYQFYRDNINEYQYKKALIQSNAQTEEIRKIFNSKNHDFVGNYISVAAYTYGITKRQILNQACFKKVFQFVIKHNVESPFICLDILTLTKRQMWEYLKKLRRQNIELTLVLTNNKISVETMYKYIERLKSLQIGFYFSSDIFNDITLTSMIPNSAGLFFTSNELAIMLKHNPAFFKEITNFYVNSGVKLLLEVNRFLMTRFEHSKIDIITD